MEKAILVGVQLPKSRRRDVESSLAELMRLAETAGARTETIVVQKREKLDPAYLIGEGKAHELRGLVEEHDIHTVIFDEDLKPIQQKNLEEVIGAKIIDRTRLILDIFAKRARTREGILQVERAQHSYYLPRLSKRGVMLDSQVGGIGTRGPGERKLEVDQRRIRDRISVLDSEIDLIRRQREILRKRRMESGQSVVAIVGYTNAGKSTLLNYLSHSQAVYADDKLFATLDPTTRKVQMPGGRIALFTDTVGFINKLPHTLVAAFRATLEEITQADCILHVIDVSHPDYPRQVQTVHRVLEELHAGEIPIVTAYNKADSLSMEERERLEREDAVLVSARTGYGVEHLLEKIEDVLNPRLYPHHLTVPLEQGAVASRIYELAVVKERKDTADGIVLDIESSRDHWQKIQSILRESARETANK